MFILDLEIKYTTKAIELFQNSYIQKVLEKFRYSNSLSVTILYKRKPINKRKRSIEIGDISFVLTIEDSRVVVIEAKTRGILLIEEM